MAKMPNRSQSHHFPQEQCRPCDWQMGRAQVPDFLGEQGCPHLVERLAAAVAAAGKHEQLPPHLSAGEPNNEQQQNGFSAGGLAVNVFIDDLTTVAGLISDSTLWRGFLHELLRLIDRPSPAASLVALLHADVLDPDAAELIELEANVLASVEPLTAGRSVDVSGRVSMALRNCRHEVPWGRTPGDPQRQFFFQATDRGMRFLQQYTAS